MHLSRLADMQLTLFAGLTKDVAVILLHQLFRLAKWLIEWVDRWNHPVVSGAAKAESRVIRFRHKSNYYACSAGDQFISTHKEFCDPTAVLDDRVSLYSFDRREAIFVKMPKSVAEYSADKVPFIWMKLFSESIELICMPIASFHQLADSVGPPKDRILICSHAGRVGSTLLASMVQRLSPELFSFSSHHSFYCLHNLKKLSLPADDYNRFVKSAAWLTFKPIEGKKVFFTKGPCKTVDISEDLLAVLPTSAHVFLDREAKSTIRSYERVFTHLLDNRRMLLQMKANWMTGVKLFNLGGYHTDAQNAAFQFLQPTLFEMFSMVWASFQLQAKDIRSRVKSLELSFANLTSKDRAAVISTLQGLAHLAGLSEPDFNAALQATELDSQEGSVYGKSCQSFSYNQPVTEEMRSRVAQFCSHLKLAPIA